MLVRQNRLAIQPKTSPLQPDSSSLQVTRIQMMIVVVGGEGGGWAGLGWTGCRLGCRGWTSPSPSPNPTRSITRIPRPCARCARRPPGGRAEDSLRVLGTTSYYCTATGQGSGWESECVVSCGLGGKKQMCVPGMAEVFHGRRTVRTVERHMEYLIW